MLHRAIGVALTLTLFGCGSDPANVDFDGGNGDQDGGDEGGFGGNEGGLFVDGDVEGGTSCVNLQCQQVKCESGGKTTVSGTVFDPAGKVPLYNVVVYVPNAPVGAMTNGATCDKCADALSGHPLVTALTDTKGQFTLADVPVGKNIPLVIQAGKWRRQITIPNVASCTDTKLTDVSQTRLPKNHTEGDIPRIALTTGGADPLECLLRKIGVDDSEFGVAGSSARIHYFAGSGGTSSFASGTGMPPAQTLWGSLDSLKAYDIVLLACEGAQNPSTKPATALKALYDYTSIGGRVFASHWHNYWFEKGPAPFPTVATFTNSTSNPPDPFTGTIDETFPKGKALADWLMNVKASTTAGQLVIHQARNTVSTVNASVSQRWIYASSPVGTQYFTFNTPIGTPPDNQCGRVVFSDLHVSSGDKVDRPFPTGCTTSGLSAQEKALEFMLFDLSSRVCDDKAPPEPPPK